MKTLWESQIMRVVQNRCQLSKTGARRLSGAGVAIVWRWVDVYRTTGCFWTDDALGQRHDDNALFNPHFLRAVTSLLAGSPEAFLGEISETLWQLSELSGWKGIPLSPATVSRML